MFSHIKKNCVYCRTEFGCKTGHGDKHDHDCLNCNQLNCSLVASKENQATSGSCGKCSQQEQAALFLAKRYGVFSYMNIMSTLAHEQRRYGHNLTPCGEQVCTECNLARCPVKITGIFKLPPVLVSHPEMLAA